MKRLLSLTTVLLMLLAFTAVAADQPDSSKADQPDSSLAADSIVTTKLGVKYQDLKVGEGPAVKMGTKTTVHYTVWLDHGDGTKGRMIQSSKDRGQPFDCTVGYQLIQGWSDGMIGMKEGGIRRMWVPSKFGYGPGGMPPMIPGNADLVFEIELLKIRE